MHRQDVALSSVATFNAVAAAFGGDGQSFQRFIETLTGERAGTAAAKKIDEIEAMEFELPEFAVAEG